jgi:nucleotide-binding universal stress UspA family protein
MTQTFRKILCPLDFDENSMAALEVACKVAAQNDASLYIMHVVAMPPHATEMPPEALKLYPVWERDVKLKLESLGRRTNLSRNPVGDSYAHRISGSRR